MVAGGVCRTLVELSSAYPENVDELGVGDVAVLVLVKVVEDDSQLLTGEEDAQLRHEFFELQLLEDAILIAVEALPKKQTVKQTQI